MVLFVFAFVVHGGEARRDEDSSRQREGAVLPETTDPKLKRTLRDTTAVHTSVQNIDLSRGGTATHVNTVCRYLGERK